jgi:hypothetical protein
MELFAIFISDIAPGTVLQTPRGDILYKADQFWVPAINP